MCSDTTKLFLDIDADYIKIEHSHREADGVI
jgi:hypothetical protein